MTMTVEQALNMARVYGSRSISDAEISESLKVLADEIADVADDLKQEKQALRNATNGILRVTKLLREEEILRKAAEIKLCRLQEIRADSSCRCGLSCECAGS